MEHHDTVRILVGDQDEAPLGIEDHPAGVRTQVGVDPVDLEQTP